MEKEIKKRNEIVSILSNIRLRHNVVVLKDKAGKDILSGYITKSDSNHFSIFFDKVPDCVPLKNVSLNFEYNKFFYTSDALDLRILNLPIKTVELNLPENVSFHPLRKFTRVSLPTEMLRLVIKQLESKPQESTSITTINMEELPPNLKKIYVELIQDEPDLKKILLMVGEDLRRYSNRFKTNIFKDIKNLSPLEKVVFIYKKTFWISDTDNLNNYVHLGDKYNIIGYEKYFEMIKKPLSPDILEQIRNNYVNRGISSYCMVPILIGDRVAGVIEVSVPDDGEYKKLTIYDIFYIKGMADILAEVVVKTKTSTESDDNVFNVVDISMGGILATTKNVYLTRTYKENSIVRLGLIMDEKELDISARIVRYDYIPGQNAGLNMAFEFLALSEDNKAEIGQFIRKFLKLQMNKEGSK